MTKRANQPLVSIVIVNYNGLQHLKKCLPSVFKSTYTNFEVIVVDNGSSDDSLKYLRKQPVKIVSLAENVGFAAGNNRGIDQAQGELLWLLNNDTEVTPTALEALVKCLLKSKTVGAVQSKLVLMDDPSKLDSVGAFLTPTGFLYHYGIVKPDAPEYNRPIELYSAKGASFLLRKKALDQVALPEGCFDESFFAYFEETDVCHRLWLSGWSVRFCPNSVVRHVMGATSTKLDSAFVQYHSFKNRINTYLTHLPIWLMFRVVFTHIVMAEVFSNYNLFFKGKSGRKIWLAVHRAYFWNVANIKTTLKKRKLVRGSMLKVDESFIYSFLIKKVPFEYYRKLLVGLDQFKDPEYLVPVLPR